MPEALTDEQKQKIASMQAEVDAIRTAVEARIERLLAQGPALEELYLKTEALKDASEIFKKSATTMRSEMWKRNMKLKLLSILGLIAIGLLITLIILGSTGIIPTPAAVSAVIGIFLLIAAVFAVARLAANSIVAKSTFAKINDLQTIGEAPIDHLSRAAQPEETRALSRQFKDTTDRSPTKWFTSPLSFFSKRLISQTHPISSQLDPKGPPIN